MMIGFNTTIHGLKNPENGYHGNGGKPKMVFSPQKPFVATDLKLGMHIQLYSGSKLGWVSPGHTSFFPVHS